MIKTFRGLLADGGQDRIRLSTIKGKVGYRIIKFQSIPEDPAGTAPEGVAKVFLKEQTAVTDKINFTDSDLLAVAYYSGGSATNYPQDLVIIFDSQVFNQDIYITSIDSNDTANINYYLELEVIPLDDAGAEYTTLKDMRQS